MNTLYHRDHRPIHFHDEFQKMSREVLDSIPTFDKYLDSFFNHNAEAIITEWGLVTDDDLSHLKNKLEFLSYEVGRLVIEKQNIENRVTALKSAIEDLEKR